MWPGKGGGGRHSHDQDTHQATNAHEPGTWVQQSKMLALAGGLHRRLGAKSVVIRLDDNLLQLIWKQVEQRCIVPPVEEAVEPSEVDGVDENWDDDEDWDEGEGEDEDLEKRHEDYRKWLEVHNKWVGSA